MADPITLPDLTDNPPAGPNLELDAGFGEMERAAQGKAESQYGSTIEAAVPPDWKEAASLAAGLLDRTRDLRVMVMFTIARLNLNDMPGFAAGLSTIRQHIETMWDHVHPQLDPEDDNDPLLRANALLLLAHPGRVLRPLRDVPLAIPGRLKPVTWRDIAIMNGGIEAEPGREKLTDAQIRGAFADTDPVQLAALRDALESAHADLLAIPAAFDAQAGTGKGPNFKDLPKLVHDIARDVTRYQAMAVEISTEAAAEADAAAPQADQGAGPVGRPSRAAASIQAISVIFSRDDALHALALAAAYFRDHEPSSPLPLLIDRARRLAPMAFMDILRDLAPDGLQQAQIVAGPTEG
jgi:type VI secretion system protein ImpA